MNSSWNKSVVTWFKKEARCEFRSKHGLFSSALFGFMAVITAVFASFDETFPPNLAAGFLCLVLIFSSVVTTPRVFLIEEDQKTLELARLMSDPSIVYSGKTLFCVLTSAIGGILFSSIFVGMTENTLERWDVLIFGSLLFAVCLALCLCLCSALVIGAENRYVLAGVVALPLLFPLVFCAVGVLKFAFGEGSWGAAFRNLVVMSGYGLGLGAVGPILIDAVWGRRRDPTLQTSLPQNRKDE